MTRALVHRLAAQAQAAYDMVYAVGKAKALVVLPPWLLRREFDVFAMPLREVAPGPAPHGVRLAPLAAGDLPAVRRLHPAMTEAEVRGRWHQGQVCDVGWIGLDAAYYHWLATRPFLDPYLGMSGPMVEVRKTPN